ncbi:kinase-like domain-containing protein [Mycena polygramma]|nr:kinase-like domain-containing protein [Mycena polygramma]
MEYKFEFSNNGFPKWKFHFIRGLPADRSTVHGDLTPVSSDNANRREKITLSQPNVLITAEGAGCLADFGLSSIFDQNFAFTHSTTSAMGGVRRYEAPEILNAPAGTRKNHASDVYAFACVSYYVLADREPFFELANLNPFQLVEHIANGGRPLWPTETPQPEETVWSLFQQCWETDPNQRPNISQIIHRLSSSPVDSAVTPRTHWDETTTARSRHALQDASLLPSPAMIERRLMGNDLVALQYRAARLHMSGIEHFQGGLVFSAACRGLIAQQPKELAQTGPQNFPLSWKHIARSTQMKDG